MIADQFEEVFTLTPEQDRRPFAKALIRALGKAPFTLLVTLRADFYSQILTLDRDLSDRLAPAQINIGALTREELRETIVAPAKLVGLEYEPGLVDRILRDVGSEPGNLPLLEFALTGLWSGRRGRTLTNEAYNDIGGVAGALAQRAETEFARFSLEEQAAVRRLFSGLVRVATPEEGSEDTRQRLELKETDALAIQVAQALSHKEVRQLVMGRPESAGASQSQTVEVAHEALIRNWERLRLWLNEDREFLFWRQRTQILVVQWEQHGRDPDDLLRGVTLSEAERWLAARPGDLTGIQAQFIGESTNLHERERAKEEQRRVAEIENVERLREAAESRARTERLSARRLRTFSWFLAALLLAALGAAGFALWERTTANARAWVARSISAQRTDPELSVLFAAQGVAAAWPFGRTALMEAEQQLHNALIVSRIRLTLSGTSNFVYSVAWSPDGKRLATASLDRTAKVWDGDTGKELLTLSGHSNVVTSVAWSPDGQRLATGSGVKTAKLWDADTGRELLTLSGHNGNVLSVAWSPDGTRLATGSGDNTARVWGADSGTVLAILSGHNGAIWSVAWSPDGQRLATGSRDQTAKVWDAGASKELQTLGSHSGTVFSVAWSPDGKRLATASADKTAKIWDANTGQELRTLSGHSGAVYSVAWNPDGKRLATGSGDNTAKVWDAATGKVLRTLSGHSNIVFSVAWSPDGQLLATASEDHSAKIWDADTGKELRTLGGHSGYVLSVAWSPNGQRLATGSDDGTAKLWDAAMGKEPRTLGGHGNAVSGMAWSPDGQRLVTGSRDQTAKVWDAATGKELLILGGRTGAVSSVAWSPDGKRLATAGADNAVQLYAIGLRDLIALARQRVSAHPSEENCQKFLHENCPAFPKLSIW